MDLQNIIVATDLSEHCGTAAKWAQQFKEHVGAATLYVEHVIELSLSSWVQSAFEVLDDAEKVAAAKEQVRKWFHEHAGADPDEIILRAGSCLAQLTEVVEELEGESLLVVSMSGKGAFTRFFLGSTAHALASQPPCPVAIVHPEHTEIRQGTAIVTGTDMSRNGKYAVAYAAALADHVGVPLEIVHAYGATSSPLMNLHDDAADETYERVTVKKIRSQPGLDVSVDVNIEVAPEEPGDAIVEHARSLDSDLIVMGHSGESLFVQNVLGSVAQRVLNHMPCSMIVVPGVAHDHPVFQDEEE